MKIFHIVNKKEWLMAKENGVYRPQSLLKEGFIHCSRADQVLQVANSFFKGQENLIILRINVPLVASEIKTEAPLEAPWSDIHYPHIYGELNLDAVETEVNFPVSVDGSFSIPDDLL
jgi:uncharacterized protein (DUF952 family)